MNKMFGNSDFHVGIFEHKDCRDLFLAFSQEDMKQLQATALLSFLQAGL